MTEIKDVKIYELEESIIASGLAMRLSPYDYNFQKSDPEEFKKHFNRCCKLVKASKNTDVHCHDNFLTGIRVSFDIKYPQYLSPELQRYHFLDIVTSMSKMHKLLKMNVGACCNKYVTDETKNNLNKYIEEYNNIAELSSEDASMNLNIQEERYKRWMRVVSNCPLGLELWMRISTNYKQLQTIYYQRKDHKLKEDWGAVIKMIEDLPYFNNFILGKDEC